MSHGEHEKASQNWEGMDGETAWHLIDRHADGWADIGRMMQEWLDANSSKQQRDELLAEQPKWINPNDKTQARYLPNIAKPVLFCHDGKTYIGKHTGGCFKAMTPPFAIFRTWDCHWMPLPEANVKGGA